MADRRGYRGRSWQWWAKRQLEHYTASREKKRDEELARSLDAILALPEVKEKTA
jgi:hypothetical protein